MASALCLAVIIALTAGSFAQKNVSDRLLQGAGETLAVQIETLNGLLDRYRLLASFLSSRPDVPALFLNNDITRARSIASRIAGYSGAMDVRFLHADGSLLTDGIGLFQDFIPLDSELRTAAEQGRLGRGVRLLENGNLAYIFTHGVRAKGSFIGIIAIYVALDEIQAAWSLSTNPIAASTANGLVIISNQPDWVQQPWGSIHKTNNTIGSNDTVLIEGPEGARPHLEVSRTLPLLGWTLSVLADAQPVTTARKLWATLAILGVIGLAAATQTIINRRHAFQQRERADRATALRLERLVRDRTRELSTSNNALTHEIEVRSNTEEQLRKTQSELIQTGKLAALGQMSTALSHEYNQPLSAIKSYAENAAIFLDRGRANEARENIGLISDLTDRMAKISTHLRNFARKPNLDYTNVNVSDVVREALQVTSPRIRAESADVTVQIQENLPAAQAGHVRLQQVIVNLILNGLDAAKNTDQPHILVQADAKEDMISIKVSDNGVGIDPSNFQNIFDPFFTTKPVGQGLGLGLSISYNIVKDFGGQLSATNAKMDGAEFTIALRTANTDKSSTSPRRTKQ